MVKVKSRYAYDQQDKPGVSFVPVKGPKGQVLNPQVLSLTNQADSESCDINVIFAKFEKTGLLVDPVTGVSRTPVYGDFSNVGDYHDMKCRLAKAEQAFACFPAKLRNRFNNDVQQLVDFLADSKNDKEAVDLGLKDREVLLTALADDGVTKITPEDRARYDEEKAKKAAAAQAAAAGASGTGTGS